MHRRPLRHAASRDDIWLSLINLAQGRPRRTWRGWIETAGKCDEAKETMRMGCVYDRGGGALKENERKGRRVKALIRLAREIKLRET